MLTLDNSEALSSPAEQAESVASREIIEALQAISPERRAALVIVGIEGLLLCGSGDHTGHPGGHADVAGRARPRGIARPARRRCPAPLNQGGRAMSRRDFTERDIHMALDGELPSEERADYEDWLDANPEMKARSARFEADRARLRETFAGVLDERVARRLTELVIGEAARPAASSTALAHGRRGGNPARARGGGRLSRRHRRPRRWRRRPRTNSPRMRSPPTPSMPPNSVTRSRSAPTTRTICSAGCRSALALTLIAPT